MFRFLESLLIFDQNGGLHQYHYLFIHDEQLLYGNLFILGDPECSVDTSKCSPATSLIKLKVIWLHFTQQGHLIKNR